jgi:hypothetical protein
MQLRTEILIASPPADVWKILTEFRHYSEWNPFIISVSGTYEVGAELEVVISVPESRERRIRPTLLTWDAGRELRWRGKLGSEKLFVGEHFFRLEETPGGETRFIHGEDFSGILVRFLKNELTRTSRGFVYMNQALKRRAETLYPAIPKPSGGAAAARLE